MPKTCGSVRHGPAITGPGAPTDEEVLLTVTAGDPAAVGVAVVLGTRPDALKLAPVVRALSASPLFEPVVIATGQHREMLDQVFEVFDLRPQVDLHLLQDRQTLTSLTSRVLTGLEALLADLAPAAVLVQGDTTTTFAGALAAFYARIPLVHVEAGLRTHDRWSPYPEEMNRRLTSQLAGLHLAPTEQARDNLLVEGVAADAVVVTGNTSIDALLWAVNRPAPDDALLASLRDDPRRVLLVTLHRRESWGAPLRAVGGALARLARLEPDLLVVLPLHRNPVVREALVPILGDVDNVRLVEPQDYGVFVHLMARADIILTDSGGIQEEGPSLGKPVLVARESTERPEGLAAGTSLLVGTDAERIVEQVRRLLHDSAAHRAMARATNPYGDGRAAERTVLALARFLGLSEQGIPDFRQ